MCIRDRSTQSTWGNNLSDLFNEMKPTQRNLKYLRRKSERLHDYTLGLLFFGGIYFMFKIYNDRLNPREITNEDERTSKEGVNPMDLLTEFFKKKWALYREDKNRGSNEK
eukprot:TRINITY_DN13298_c0_g1_i3.p1 TRINITY_DN13298_c0_g1~~TRINITY_DN13298_c0_g1_i3.p1  ORF type:complete len:129 (-),score=33.42 TRINITY_DN13298_c0_g1_i3:153-482(-)